MGKKREELLIDLIKLFLRLTRHFGHRRRSRLDIPRKYDLSPNQAHLLFSIANKKEGIYVKDLADELGITSGAVSQFVDILATKNLVKREVNSADRRMIKLNVTDEVKAHFEMFRKECLYSISQKFDVLSDQEILQLIAILSKVDGRLHFGKFNKKKMREPV
jgi:DNA-binding MarR family transcriptional regulator